MNALLDLQSVNVAIGQVQLLEGISLQVAPGQILGPVSYTHLDVYKRQAIWALLLWPAARWPT